MPVQSKRLNKNEHHKTVESVSDGNQTYNILKEVGRGGFAVVFEAVNVETNEHYAMKRFLLDSIDAESLGQIEAEIDLMKKLNHPNIVKYVDTLRTEGYLYVVLEFMENGSLQTTLRKTGKFSESVAAIYIVQILRGLKYLHEQGVLHRDIKGANILTSLDGQVKLADFGVAMKLSDAPSEDEQFVVGTPYWMAPEIIEMSTPTPACDIWSVGCTVIELLTGKPPYFDLAPMAALFRIVQDDYPPLPEGISQALRDFLLLCFQKEPTMRKGAERLLEHPWLQNTSNAVLVHTSDLLPSKDGIPDEVVVNTIRKFQLDMKSKPTKKTGQLSSSSPASGNKSGRNESAQASPTPNKPKPVDNSPPTSTSSKTKPKQQPVDDEDENWDFDEPTVKLSLSGTNHQAKSSREPASQNASTTKIKLPLNQTNTNQAIKGDLKISNAQLSSIMTDENWEDEMDAADTPPRNQQKPRGHARVETHVSVSSLVPNLSKYQDTADDADLNDINLEDSLPSLPPQQSNRRNQGTLSSKDSEASKSSANANMTRVLHQRMKQNVNEENVDTFDDLEVDEHYFQQNETRDVDMRRSREIVQLMASIKPDSTERDVIEKCNQLLQTFDKHPEQREHLITHHGVLPVLDMLEARSGLRPNIPVLDMLEARSGTIRPHVLRVINKIVEGSIRAQEQLSLVGLIPIVMRLLEYSPNKGRLGSAEPQGVDPVVLEAGRFVHQISSTSSLTLQMLIGAGGLPVLVHMVAFSNQMCNNSTSINGNDAKQMVYMGLDCIIEVFSVKSSRTRDFCKLFVKLGILPHLSLAFQYIMGMSPPASAANSQKSHLGVEPQIVTEVNRDNYEPERWQYGLRIANIFWIFSRYEVTEQMSRDGVLEVMMGALRHSSLTSPIDKFRHLYDHDEAAKSIVPNEYAEIAELLLKSIKNFTMEPTALNDLEQVGAIGTLIDLLDGPIRDRCKNHILPSLYNLCRIEIRRLDSAAKEGIIPHLQRIILEGSHLKQFALPILCDLVRASLTAREELWRNDGVVFYINLLDEKYWQTFALNSLTYWLYHDNRVEGVLIEPSNVAKLVEFFRNASAQTISTILSPLSKMLSKSPPIARALGSSGLFVLSIVKRLNTSEAIVLRSLLKILQCIHQNHPSPRQLVLDHNLYSIVKGLAQAEGQVVVNSIANRLLKDFQASTLT